MPQCIYWINLKVRTTTAVTIWTSSNNSLKCKTYMLLTCSCLIYNLSCTCVAFKMADSKGVFLKIIQDWIFKSETIRKWILWFFTKQINRRSLGSWCIQWTEESSVEVDSSVPLIHHDLRDLFSKEMQNTFSDSFGFKNPILDFF